MASLHDCILRYVTLKNTFVAQCMNHQKRLPLLVCTVPGAVIVVDSVTLTAICANSWSTSGVVALPKIAARKSDAGPTKKFQRVAANGRP